MTNEAISKQIHESDIFGTFIEIGAGQPVAHELFNIAGASKTIYNATSPYSKELQERVFATAGMRSVSKEAVNQILDTIFTDPVNTSYVSSIQLSDAPEKLTHGWIGLRYKETEKFYHITITHYSEDRAKLIWMIGSIGLRILSCKNDLTALKEMFASESAMYSCIDIIEDGTKPYIAETLSILESGLENPITISKEGKLIRLEELSRAGNLILMKGSFNPIHNHHLEIIKAAEKQYPTGIPCFAISLDTYSKGRLDTASLVDRIKMINKLGYPVVVFRNAYFNQNVSHLRNHRFNKDCIIFPLGGDTINRLIKSSYKGFAEPESKEGKNHNILAFNAHFDNVLFAYMNRPGSPLIDEAALVSHFKNLGTEESNFSSTDIRKSFELKDYKSIKAIVPALVYSDIISYLKATHKRNIKNAITKSL